MDRNDVTWKGYWPASPTPFTVDGALDEPTLRELMQFYLEEGMHGVLVNGSTGEWWSQSDDERKRVAEIAVEELGGRIPVLVGVTTFTATHSAELGKHAAGIGADGILATPPPYMRPEPDEILQFYIDLTSEVQLPFMVYNMPAAIGVDMKADLVLRLAELPNVVALKDGTANTASFYATLAAVKDRLRVFGAFLNPIGLAALRSIGGDGFIGGGALMGREQPEFFEAVWRGDDRRALEIATRSAALTALFNNPDWSGKFGGGQMKAAMRILGQPGGYPRRPRLPVEDPKTLAAIEAALAAAGLLIRRPAPVAS
jgi:4-hydroxy-tetrahydrodipicolinate synthase